MTNRSEYKEALSRLDKDTRVCIKHLERLINDKFVAVLRAQQPLPRVNLTNIESTLDSLQKQIDGLRSKVDVSYDFVKEFDRQEQYLKKLAKNADEILEDMKIHFEQLYKSGYYKEGERRKIREEKLLENLKSEWTYKR